MLCNVLTARQHAVFRSADSKALNASWKAVCEDVFSECRRLAASVAPKPNSAKAHLSQLLDDYVKAVGSKAESGASGASRVPGWDARLCDNLAALKESRDGWRPQRDT